MNNRTRQDGILLLGMYMPACVLMLQLFLYKIMGVEENSTVHSLIMLMSAVPMAMSAWIWVKRQHNLIVAVSVYALVFVIFGINYLIFAENREFLHGFVFHVFFISMPIFINGLLVNDRSLELSVLKNASWFIFLIGIIYFLFDMFGKAYKGYNMAYGYYMLIPACFFSYVYFDSKKAGYLLASLASILPVLIMGSRGPVVAWVIYFALLILISDIRAPYKLFIVAVVLLVVISRDWVFRNLYRMFSAAGVESRTLRLLLSGEISRDSGRGLIQSRCLEMIRENWLLGNGIGADQRVIGTYPHNLFIEILLHFGIVAGVPVLVFLILAAIKKLVNTDNKKLYFFYFCVGFLPTMLSGTYLTSISFWLFMGYVFRPEQKCPAVSNEAMPLDDGPDRQPAGI